MLKKLNELFHAPWFIILYTVLWTGVIFIPMCIIQNKNFKKRNNFI